MRVVKRDEFREDSQGGPVRSDRGRDWASACRPTRTTTLHRHLSW
jgi:hypothetical protein